MRRWEVGKVRIHQDGKMWRCASWRFHTWTLWRRVNLFTHSHSFRHIFYPRSRRHFTHRLCYTRTLLDTDAFTHRPCYTQTLLHTKTFTHTHTHSRFYTQTLLHIKLLHADSCAHRHFYTQMRLHTDAFTHRQFHTQIILLTDACTRKRIYTHTCDLLHPVPEN